MMTPRKGLPIGPLALAMRRSRRGGRDGSTGGRSIAVAAILLGLALAGGIVLLLSRG
jgi:hypothetical protein